MNEEPSMHEGAAAGGPLAGLRVVELANELQGPYAGLTLSELGAEVVKVETRGAGDSSRNVNLGRTAPGAAHPTFGHYFYLSNRGKRSVTLDLKTAEGKAVLMRLLESAD